MLVHGSQIFSVSIAFTNTAALTANDTPVASADLDTAHTTSQGLSTAASGSLCIAGSVAEVQLHPVQGRFSQT
jgi:hypothetical protein